ncbi:MAG: aldehyde ferredoxin oxidoreductase family protein [Thermoleophilia bacterium]
MNGWTGTILRVDLTTGEISDEAVNPQVARDYVGGRGLGIYYLNTEMDATVDPLSPENMLCMFTGPLTGTRAATGARYMIMTKSPLTGALTTSNSGGHFPTEMKRAGYDGIIVTGRAAEPSYLFVSPGKSELRLAGHLWGKDTEETTDLLLAETDLKARVACIGPAGERLVRFASVQNEKHRAAGRSGVGAVWGSKNLKAVVVKAEGKDVPLHDPEAFAAYHKGVIDTYKAGAAVTPVGLSVYGTTYAVGHGEKMGDLPTKNFQRTKFEPWEGGIEKEFHEKHFIRRGACFSCPIGCARISKVEKPDRTLVGEGPEYETWFAMGSNCEISDLEPIVEANFLCNRLGLDTITMGVTLACAMELVDRGHLDEAEVGRSLPWGDGAALVELTEKTALREGFGDLMAEGSYRLAERYGHPELAMTAKKQELAGYIPRRLQGMGLAYATSPIGGSHMRGDTAYFELFGTPVLVDASEVEGKADLVVTSQNLSTIIDSSGLCIFFAHRALITKDIHARPTGILEYLNAATGADYTIEELWEAGERIFTAERHFLARAGFSAADDTIPPRELEEPLPDGPGKGQVCHLPEMLEEYYRLRGWDADGIPTAATLDRLRIA